jgi:hypothetical protein
MLDILDKFDPQRRSLPSASTTSKQAKKYISKPGIQLSLYPSDVSLLIANLDKAAFV